jgi:putative membrane protein
MNVLAEITTRDEWHDHRGMRWGGILIALLLVALLVLVIVLIVRNWSRPSAAQSGPAVLPRSSAEDLLAERLARGEIDVDEYQRRRDALRSG